MQAKLKEDFSIFFCFVSCEIIQDGFSNLKDFLLSSNSPLNSNPKKHLQRRLPIFLAFSASRIIQTRWYHLLEYNVMWALRDIIRHKKDGKGRENLKYNSIILKDFGFTKQHTRLTLSCANFTFVVPHPCRNYFDWIYFYYFCLYCLVFQILYRIFFFIYK